MDSENDTPKETETLFFLLYQPVFFFQRPIEPEPKNTRRGGFPTQQGLSQGKVIVQLVLLFSSRWLLIYS